MNLSILDKLTSYENKQYAVHKMFEYLEETLASNNNLLSGMSIDGVIIHDDYYNYITENLDKINQIQVEVVSVKDALINTVGMSQEYLERVIPELEGLADAFYFGADDNEYIDKLGQLFEGIQWLLEAGQSMEDFSFVIDGSEKGKWDNVVNDLHKLDEEFGSMKEAVMNMDKVLIGDILKYEIKEILESIEGNFKGILGRE